MSDAARTGDARLDETAAGEVTALEPTRGAARWPMWLGAAMTVAMVAGLGHELFDDGLAGLRRTAPASPLFYLVFAASYFALPVADWVIYRHVWHVPVAAFGALNRKRIANDVVLGYSGDAYWYAWARARLTMVAAPFGAVKDATLLSGMANNVATVLLGVVALTLGGELMSPLVWRAIAWSLAIPIVISAGVLVLRRRVFTLPAASLWFIFAVDLARIAATTGFLALAWALAMPKVALGMWLFLVAARQLVSQLPLLPNKDLLFANFAILVIGHDRALTELIAFTAGITLVVHLALVAVFAAVFVGERTIAWRRRGSPSS